MQQPDAPAQIIARPKNKQETVVVALDEFKGTHLVHVRQHYVDGQGERPTTKGICLNVGRLGELRSAIVAAEQEAERRGLLNEEGGEL
jgi:Transcriptional Coactivator p15 (PC4)